MRYQQIDEKMLQTLRQIAVRSLPSQGQQQQQQLLY
jgi:hypothetical protein